MRKVLAVEDFHTCNARKLLLRRRRLRSRSRRLLRRNRRLRCVLGPLDSRQNGIRSWAASPHGEDGERNRRHHKEYRRPGGRLGERRSCAPGPECRLATHAAKSGRDIATFSTLQQHDNDQKKAHHDVYGVNQANQITHAIVSQTGALAGLSLSNSQWNAGAEGGI
jgi:hypothetical protein